MARHNDIGKWGENLACDKLIADGYTIIKRNWRVGHLEIDIIAQKGNDIVFAEVKTRHSHDEDPIEAIDNRKIRLISTAANAFMRNTSLKGEARFDVFGITGTPDDYRIEHIEDAFMPPIKTYY